MLKAQPRPVAKNYLKTLFGSHQLKPALHSLCTIDHFLFNSSLFKSRALQKSNTSRWRKCLLRIILDTGQTFEFPQLFYLPGKSTWRCLLGVWVGLCHVDWGRADMKEKGRRPVNSEHIPSPEPQPVAKTWTECWILSEDSFLKSSGHFRVQLMATYSTVILMTVCSVTSRWGHCHWLFISVKIVIYTPNCSQTAIDFKGDIINAT